MTRRSALSSAANAAAVALFLASAGQAGAVVNTINTNDIVFSNEGSTAPSLFLIKSATTFEDTNVSPVNISQPGWGAQNAAAGLAFDNLSGVYQSASGNLLGTYFGNTTNGGSIYSWSTDSSGNAPELLFGNGTGISNGIGSQSQVGSTAFTSRGLTGSIEMGGAVAVSPNNDEIAIESYNGGITDVLTYNPSASHNGTGSTIGTGTLNAGQAAGTLQAYTSSISQDVTPAFLDETVTGTITTSHLLGLDAETDTLELQTITHNTSTGGYTFSTPTTPASLPVFNGAGTLSTFTSQTVYNPQVSPYIYVIQADFVPATGADETTLGVFTFNAATDSSFSLVNEFNLSSNNGALGSFETGQYGSKELTMDSRGDLFYSVYQGGSLESNGESIFELKNVGWNNSGWGYGSLGGSATLGYTYNGVGTTGLSGDLETNPAAETTADLLHFNVPTVSGSSFSGMDIGMGVPIQAPTPLLWDGGKTGIGASDTSGTWDTATTSNWYNTITLADVQWAENDAAEFGAGSHNSPVTVTIPSGVTHTVSVMTMYPGSPAYTITGGTISLVGDNLGDGIADNIASFTIASNLQLGIQGAAATPINVLGGETIAISGAVSGSTITLTAGDGTTTFVVPDGTLSFTGAGTVLLTNPANAQPGTNIAANTLVLSPSGGTFGMLGSSYAFVAASAGVGTHLVPAHNSGNLFDGGGTLIINGSGTITQGLGFSGNGTIAVGTNTLTVTGPLEGSGGFTQTGVGTVIMDGLDDASTGTSSGPIEVAQGTLVDNAGTLIASTTGGNPLGLTALGEASLNIGGPLGAGTVVLTPTGETGGNGITGLIEFHLDKNGALVATGAGSQEIRDGGYIMPTRQLSSNPSQVYVSTPLSTDTLALAGEVEQYSDYGGYQNFTGSSYTTINKIGLGKLILTSGGYTSNHDYNGQWNVSGGQLEIGPALSSVSTTYTNGVIPSGSKFTSTSSPYLGGFGEPLNALGYANQGGTTAFASGQVGLIGAYGDPDQPSSITVSSGGLLAIAVDSPNSNPNNTTVPLNPTPNYLRSSVTLAGGTLASTGSEVVSSNFDLNNALPTSASVTYTTTQAYSYNMPDGVPVSAQVGGTFTVASSSTSGILLYDPNGTITSGDSGARNFSLVGGAAEYQVAVGPLPAGTTLTYATNWAGTLSLSAGSLTGTGTRSGGVFTIDRTYSFNDVSEADGGGTINVGTTGLVNVSAGANIQVGQGAGLVLNGIGVLSTGALADTGTANYDNNTITGLPTIGTGVNSVAINNNSSTAGNTTTGGTVNIATNSYGTTSLGSGSFGLTADGGTQIVGAITGTGDTGVQTGATLVMSKIVQSSLQVNGNAIILSGGGTANTGSLGALTMSSTAQLDIGDHSLVIEYGAGNDPVGDLSFARTARNYPANSLQRYAQTAFAGFAWTGPGITSSEAANDGNGLLAVGIADENDLGDVYPGDNTVADGGTGTWQGQPINDTNNVLVRMTYYGDGNDDGVVNRFDVTALSQGYNGIAGYVGWSDGDYTYSGDITKTDVSLLANSYLFQGAPLGNAITAGQAQYLLALDPDMSAAAKADFESIAGTPEPASMALLGAATVGLLARRRRRH